MTSDYKIEPKLWVVERKNRNGWRPTRWAEIEKYVSRCWMAEFKQTDPGDYRVVKYITEVKK